MRRKRGGVELLNKQQREFRKQMKKTENKRRKERVIAPYNYPNESYPPIQNRKRRFFFWVLGITAVLFGINVLSAIGGHPEKRVPIKVESWDTSDEDVHDYLSRTSDTSNQLSAVWERFTSMKQVDAMTTKEFDALKKEVMRLKHDVKSDKDEFRELEFYFLGQIELTKNMISTYQGNTRGTLIINAFKINQLRNRFNENLSQEQLMVIHVLKKQGMPYELNEDGSLSYQHKNIISDKK